MGRRAQSGRADGEEPQRGRAERHTHNRGRGGRGGRGGWQRGAPAQRARTRGDTPGSSAAPHWCGVTLAVASDAPGHWSCPSLARCPYPRALSLAFLSIPWLYRPLARPPALPPGHPSSILWSLRPTHPPLPGWMNASMIACMHASAQFPYHGFPVHKLSLRCKPIFTGQEYDFLHLLLLIIGCLIIVLYPCTHVGYIYFIYYHEG